MTILPRPANARISALNADEVMATVGAMFPAREAVAILPRALRGRIAHGSRQAGNVAPTSRATATHATRTSHEKRS